MRPLKTIRKWMRPIAWVFAAAALSTGVIACDDDDPVEEAAEEVADEIDDATN